MVAMDILIADDEPMIREVLRRLIQRDIPSRIFEVESGSEAWRHLNRNALPHLCLYDIYMDGFDGLSLARMMKVDDRMKKIPVIIVTGSKDQAHEEEAERIGAIAFLRKPFTNQDILKSVSMVAKNLTSDISGNLDTVPSMETIREGMKLEPVNYWYQLGDVLKRVDVMAKEAKGHLLKREVGAAKKVLKETSDLCMAMRTERCAEAAIKVVLFLEGERNDCDILTLEDEIARLRIQHSKLGEEVGKVDSSE